ncbi:MAG TPA: protease modulator HflK N-terminal domain-containing protein, partial [Candidatus Omnitrophota bacterium]|nr:protease modulator HflK N-terminal domain-containing protein [Candidatus Omnitrophota bacterium]
MAWNQGGGGGPWGGGGGGGNGPWGRGPGGGGGGGGPGTPPDFEEIIRRGQEKLRRAVPRQQFFGQGKGLLIIVALAAA